LGLRPFLGSQSSTQIYRIAGKRAEWYLQCFQEQIFSEMLRSITDYSETGEQVYSTFVD